MRPPRKGEHVITSLALVAVAIGASAYAYFVDRRLVSDADRAARPNDVFPSFRIDEVRRIELVQGPQVVVLDRDGKASPQRWIIAPPGEAADPAAVDVLLRELELARRVRSVNEGEAAGLDAPRVRGRLKVGSVDYAFALGDDAPSPQGAAYMRLEREGAFVVGATLKVQLLRPPDAYRQRGVVPYGASDIVRLDVRSLTGGYTLVRSGTTLRVGESDGLRATRTATDRIFSALADARANVFVDDGEADRAVAEAVLTVVVTPTHSREPLVRWVVGGPCPGRPLDVVVVRTEPRRMAACIAKGSVDALATAGDALVDTGAFFSRADEVEEFRLEPLGHAGPRVDLARRGTVWRERAPDDRDLSAEEATSANALASALAGAQAVDVRRRRPGEVIAGRSRATLVRTGTAVHEVIDVTAPDAAGDSLALRVEDDAVLRLARSVARRFDPHPVAIRTGAVWPKPLDTASVLSIDDSCAPGRQRVELQGDRWMLRAPAGFVADPVAATDLAEAFTHAKAAAWLSENDDGTFGFGSRDACAVTLSLAADRDGPPRRVRIAFGLAMDEGYYAQASGDDAVFVAPRALRALASHPAIDPTRLRLDPAKLTRVILARALSQVVLENVGGVLVRSKTGFDADLRPAEPAEGPALAPNREDKLGLAVAAFYALDALHPGPPAPGEGFERPTLEIRAVATGVGGPGVETRIAVGAPGEDGSAEIYFARIAGIDATFAVPRSRVDAVVNAW